MNRWIVCCYVLLVCGLFGCSDEKCCCTCKYNCGDGQQYCKMIDDVLVCVDSVPEPDSTDDVAVSTDARADVEAGNLTDTSVVDGSEDALDVSVVPDSDADSTGADLHDADGPQSDAADLVEVEVEQPDGPFEFRGIWVTRWDFNSEESIAEIMDNISNWGFNAVMFQVRGNGDAYYQSNVEPWAKGLTGTLGQNPGWDPLAVAIEEAHARGLEIHAWFNTFVAWTGTTAPPLSTPHHMLYDHPEWRQHDTSGNPMAYNNSYTWVSPGIAAVRNHTIAVAVDLVENYDVDGLHFDYIRYAGPEFSHDTESEAAYNQAKVSNPSLTWGDFQRSVLTNFVTDAYDDITAARPEVKVTASVWGIYKDEFSWGGTSEGFYDYYQDSHRWVSEDRIDAICPMIYWPLTTPKGGWTDFATLADHHLSAAGNRHVYMGMNADYGSFTELVNEIDYVRSIDGPGTVLFSYAGAIENNWGTKYATGPYGESAAVPPMSWK